MRIKELIDKLTEIQNMYGEYIDVDIFDETNGNWLKIKNIETTDANEEEMISGYLTICTEVQN